MSKNLNKCLTPNEIRKFTRVILKSKSKKTNLNNTSNTHNTHNTHNTSNKIRQFCIFFIIEKFDIWDYNELLKKKDELNEKNTRLIFNCLQLLDDIQIPHKDLMEIYQYVQSDSQNVLNSKQFCLQNGGDCGDCGGGCGGACSGDKNWF